MQDIGVSIAVDERAIEDALIRMRPLVDFDAGPLMEEIAALGESQTSRRITDEKTAPDGTPWKPNWNNTSTLYATGQHLLRSLASYSSGEEAIWGAGWEYAHVHQEGMTIVPRYGEALKFWFAKGGFTQFVVAKHVTVPARPFVGLSAENRAEIEELVSDHFGRLL